MEKINKKSNAQKGITLIALVITIIVLLILAGVAINMAIDSDGLFSKANEAAKGWNVAVGEEEKEINELINTLEEMSVLYKPMITKWNIASGDEVQICLYLAQDMNGNALENKTNVTVNWGDGTKETINSNNLEYFNNGLVGVTSHAYSTTNSATVITIEGECNTIWIPGLVQLTSIEQWGYTGTFVYKFSEGDYMGQGCTGLTQIASPEKHTFRNVLNFYETFHKCTGLTTIPEDLFANCPNVTSFERTFFYCENLESIPEKLFANNLNVNNFVQTFYGCSGLTGNALPLWERVAEGTAYEDGSPDGMDCYQGCGHLNNYANIPVYWKNWEN